ncbi:MAG: tetratricopeptide repeat protein [Chloroflexota bacterium]
MGPKELFEEAQFLFIEGKEKESIDAFTKAIEAGADPFMCYLSRGTAHLKLKDTTNALSDFDKAIDINSRNARAYYYRGMVRMVRDEHDKAVADFSKALELKPDYPTAKFARATSYARLEKFDEAAKDLRAVMPEMEANVQSFVDAHGIVRTEMWKVMAQVTGERRLEELELSEDEMRTLQKWLAED